MVSALSWVSLTSGGSTPPPGSSPSSPNAPCDRADLTTSVIWRCSPWIQTPASGTFWPAPKENGKATASACSPNPTSHQTGAPDGRTSATFFAGGPRYRAQTPPDVEAALATLAAGDELTLVSEPSNQHDPRALLVAEHRGIALGWGPHVLLDYAHTTLKTPEPPTLDVVAVQPREVVPSYRLLVRLTGRLPAGRLPFDEPQWRLAVTTPATA